MLNIQNLTVSIDNNIVLEKVNFSFEKGKNYCLLGKNGSGKSSLALTVMGHPSYDITHGDILVDARSIKELEAHERAKLGIFLAFQNIPEIKGIKLFEFLRSIYSAKTGVTQTFLKFKKHILPLVESLHIDPEFLRRDLNVGFSGGERRKIEILQLKLLEPSYIFLDEVDSGLDVDAFKAMAELIKASNTADNSFIVITHYFNILEYLPIDRVYVLQGGKIVQEGLQDVINNIKTHGFNENILHNE